MVRYDLENPLRADKDNTTFPGLPCLNRLEKEMSSRVKSWFLVPNWDLTTDSVALGTVICEALGSLVAESNVLYRPVESDIGTEVHAPDPMNDFRVTVEQFKERKAGIFARFLQWIPAGVDAKAEINQNAAEEYHIEEMKTKWFVPSSSLQKKAAESDKVADFLEVKGGKEPVYMVTGIRTAKGTTVTTKKKFAKNLRAWFGIDLSSAAVPFTVGTDAAEDASELELVSFKRPGEMIFAYQLHEIRRVGEEVSGKEYHTGALLGLDEKQISKSISGNMVDESSDDAECIAAKDEQDNSECVCIAPTEKMQKG